MYKVLLVDDEALIREAISENIQWEEMGFSFMGACENGKQAIEVIEKEPTLEDILIEECKFYLLNCDETDKEKEAVERIQEAIKLWADIFPCMWW